MAKSRPQHEFLDSEESESWGALMLLHRSVLASLDTELRRAHGLAVTEFDVLITLFNAPDQRLGMSDLAGRALLSPAGTTHLVTRLERDGLVRREVDPGDRRKWFTVLTKEGDRALLAARHTHNDVLRRTLLAATSPTDRRTLRRLWRRLSEQRPHPVPDRSSRRAD
ncbi:MAG: transcriptional regulator, MarR family [Acidimicrobiales bacterium]|nr:transcriptional regulator, MarR family [Acidimicrobiales bacterium]